MLLDSNLENNRRRIDRPSGSSILVKTTTSVRATPSPWREHNTSLRYFNRSTLNRWVMQTSSLTSSKSCFFKVIPTAGSAATCYHNEATTDRLLPASREEPTRLTAHVILLLGCLGPGSCGRCNSHQILLGFEASHHLDLVKVKPVGPKQPDTDVSCDDHLVQNEHERVPGNPVAEPPGFILHMGVRPLRAVRAGAYGKA